MKKVYVHPIMDILPYRPQTTLCGSNNVLGVGTTGGDPEAQGRAPLRAAF